MTTPFFRTALTAAGLSAALAAPVLAETVLIYGEPGPNRGARAEATQWFADQVAELSGGDLRLDITWAGALFSERAAVQSLRDGVADLGSVIGVYFPQDLVTYGIADLPLDNPDPWVGMRATDALMRNNEQIQANLADQGLVYVGTYTTSAVQMGCKGPAITSVDQLAGKRVRGVGAYGQTFRDLGATLVDMTVYEAYQGLENGLIDCTQTYSYLVAALRFDEVFDSYTFIDWGQVGALGIMMNKAMFDGLTPEQQDAIMTAGAGLADEFGRIIGEANAESIQILEDAGKEIVSFSDEDRARLTEAGQPYLDDWIARADASGLDGAALLDEYRALIQQYSDELEAEGYPWERG
ncbi:C4-dicarboxylate ABC transporter substrate-binding protein [Paracoccus aestuarii]|uniref:C4-dicarboxylate ABC transporter substrate-binding protein n=1 Tax=Paracoccus aestuarii TaxID=453842 RepID=A0A418ZUM6_9RHOB|nr:C4-dicarboxylate TRAP transporter substrate-binding protein [Paracoccus aestuarii]RJL02889.1 C4-dicarboxylate ABC transporter substrate-binding protein [Paracoccus aestuarii]WCQ98958.1 C4-dicarboxylate TRAP transporter substrate-binding protein [Paracoccus aestuarii]